ncbi:MAG: nucleotidyltransferase domain-containing protein [Bacteroidota bacterium]|nr:nucleotidyltransferase domain-containing protein [Bacteroidota bacterium]
MQLINKHLDEIFSLCNKYQVEKLYVFGSIVKNNYDPTKSDIDFLYRMINRDPLDMGEDVLNLYEDLKVTLGTEIDLISEKSISNPVFKDSIMSSRVLIYGTKS